VTNPEFSLSPTERLRAIARRAFPNRPALGSAPIGASVRETWKQLAAAAEVDAWTLARAIAKDLDLAVASDLTSADPFATRLVPEKLAAEHLILPLREKGGRLVVAAACPIEGGGLRRTQFVSNRKLEVLVAPPEDIETAITSAYSRAAEQQGNAIGTLRWTEQGETVSASATEQSAVVRLGRSLLLEAIEARASDLHLQPFAGGGLVRARVDGILRRLAFIPGAVLEAIVRYFKAQGGMDPTNDRVAQDGRMSLVLGNRDYDLRLSVLPASRGERLVIRFLDQSRVYRLSGAGLSSAALQALRRLATHTAGVVLLTGPTGSGKTSTLYSMLAEINRVGVSIITVEDPVEYRVAGISQVEVNTKAGLTFATALRSILRQDPDVVLIGEIRDRETAEIATQAALTGHLVLSTLHTNDALTAFPRLIDLGVQRTVLADAIAGVVAQRLLRRICETCRAPVTPPLLPDEQVFSELTGELPAYRPVGCSACDGTGYHGRLPVTEIVEMTPELGRAIVGGESDVAKLGEFCTGPLSSMASTAARRIISGFTTAREAMRVIGQRFWTELAREFQRPLSASALAALGSEETQSSGAGVLLFETNPDDTLALAAALRDARFKVHATDDPEASRRIVEENEDVVMVIIDLDVGANGDSLAMLQRLRVALAWSRLPALVLVPEQDRALRTILEEHGVSDYVVKPASPATVVERARAVLAR
jgi:type IV pilus assembly protein PilB